MSLACDFGVGTGVGLELVMLKKHFREKPRRVVSSAVPGSCPGSSRKHTELVVPTKGPQTPWVRRWPLLLGEAAGLWSHGLWMRLESRGRHAFEGLPHLSLLVLVRVDAWPRALAHWAVWLDEPWHWKGAVGHVPDPYGRV